MGYLVGFSEFSKYWIIYVTSLWLEGGTALGYSYRSADGFKLGLEKLT